MFIDTVQEGLEPYGGSLQVWHLLRQARGIDDAFHGSREDPPPTRLWSLGVVDDTPHVGVAWFLAPKLSSITEALGLDLHEEVGHTTASCLLP